MPVSENTADCVCDNMHFVLIFVVVRLQVTLSNIIMNF